MWTLVLWWKKLLQEEREPSQFWEYRGYRRVLGGHWGRWEVRWRDGGLKLWLPSWPEYRPPPFAEQLEVEHYPPGTGM
jgi:hypothetical protein